MCGYIPQRSLSTYPCRAGAAELHEVSLPLTTDNASLHGPRLAVPTSQNSTVVGPAYFYVSQVEPGQSYAGDTTSR